MKAILEFDLPEDKSEMQFAVAGQSFAGILEEYLEWLRLEDNAERVLNPGAARDTLIEMLQRYGVAPLVVY
jgi:hypothetical protein